MYAADTRHANPRLEAKLKSLYGLRGSPAIDLSIRQPFYELLRRLDNPHRRLPPVIHVAGTNGKGSTIAIMRAVLEAAGYRVHVYTSPHLLRFNERIVLSGAEIDDAALEALLDEVLAANGELAQTFFEIKTAMAFAAFARVPADILLLEVGMGGRLDSTNVVEAPAVTVITPIGLDHQEFLGPTVTAIAMEKAGIMKPGAPCVVGAQDAEVDAALKAAAVARRAPLLLQGHEWDCLPAANGMRFRFREDHYNLPLPSLVGAHQVINAGTAVAALQCLKGFSIDEATMEAGLRAAHWPGRLQRLPAPARGWELWVDGAHNAHGAAALAAQLTLWREEGKPLYLVFGMLKRKDPGAFLAAVSQLAEKTIAVPLRDEPDSHDAETLAAVFHEQSIENYDFASDPGAAILRLCNSEAPGRIIVAGSLYLVGETLERFG